MTLDSILSVTKTRKPDFNNLLKVLNKETPDRHTLFEFFLNNALEKRLAQPDTAPVTEEEIVRCKVDAFRNAGYDYATIRASDFTFRRRLKGQGQASISANEGYVIYDRESYDKYNWEKSQNYYDGRIERTEKYLHDGMKFIIEGPGGVLESVIKLVGYDNLCIMLYDDPELVEMIFDQVGPVIIDYYSQIIGHDSVGAIVSNDDWGFNTQTMISPDDLRKYVFKWHKKIVNLAHDAGKPVILHSCGNLREVWGDITDDIGYDAKHSYEDAIKPVEDMYDELKGKIAVVGGIDVDFVCRSSEESIYNRCRKMLEKTNCTGYALGTGNSVPDYVPDGKFFSMIAAALTSKA